MKKKIAIIGIIILVLIVGIASVFLIGGREEQIENNEYVQEVNSGQFGEKTEKQTAEPEVKDDGEKTEEKKEEKPAEEKVYVPTFMYFVSDADKKDVEKTIGKLRKEFEGKVTFDIVNVDENPDTKKNFPVEGNTPMLIMLNTKNDISAFAPKCTGYDELKLQIEKALEVE